MELVSCHPSGDQNFEAIPRYFENFVRPCDSLQFSLIYLFVHSYLEDVGVEPKIKLMLILRGFFITILTIMFCYSNIAYYCSDCHGKWQGSV
jgi:hypothetical protein